MDSQQLPGSIDSEQPPFRYQDEATGLPSYLYRSNNFQPGANSFTSPYVRPDSICDYYSGNCDVPQISSNIYHQESSDMNQLYSQVPSAPSTDLEERLVTQEQSALEEAPESDEGTGNHPNAEAEDITVNVKPSEIDSSDHYDSSVYGPGVLVTKEPVNPILDKESQYAGISGGNSTDITSNYEVLTPTWISNGSIAFTTTSQTDSPISRPNSGPWRPFNTTPSTPYFPPPVPFNSPASPATPQQHRHHQNLYSPYPQYHHRQNMQSPYQNLVSIFSQANKFPYTPDHMNYSHQSYLQQPQSLPSQYQGGDTTPVKPYPGYSRYVPTPGYIPSSTVTTDTLTLQQQVSQIPIPFILITI